jgi:hypothetical protein
MRDLKRVFSNMEDEHDFLPIKKSASNTLPSKDDESFEAKNCNFHAVFLYVSRTYNLKYR